MTHDVPKIERKMMMISQLVPADYNPRSISPEALADLEASITRFGLVQEIVVNRNGMRVVGGHQRLKVLARRGVKEVPVAIVDLDPLMEKALNVSLNNPGISGEFTEGVNAIVEEIAAEVPELVESLRLDDVRFVGDGSGGSGGGAGGGTATDGDEPGEPDKLQVKWQTAVGQVWSIPSVKLPGKRHRLACGDCRDQALLERLMGGELAAWLWTDPPFGVSYVGGGAGKMSIQNDGAEGIPALLKAAFAAANGVLVDGAPIYIKHPAGPLSLEFSKAFVEVGWHWHETLVWEKNSLVLGHSDYHYRHEPILYGWKEGQHPWFGGRDKDTILAFDRPSRSELHPTTTPAALVAHCVINSSAPGTLGFEPFAGSGSVGCVAEQLGRRCNMVELDPKYAAVVLERMAMLGCNPTLDG